MFDIHMPKLVALLQFMLALVGCSLGGTSYTSRIDAGDASLYSKARVQDGVARFDCVDSSSGQCHYTLYPDACAGDADCRLAPLRRFSVARGESLQVAGLVDFRPCVSASADPLGPDCRPTGATATR